MKRLTERDSDGNVNILNDKDPSGGYYIRDLDLEEDSELLCKIAEKLARYEDLEEQGLLFKANDGDCEGCELQCGDCGTCLIFGYGIGQPYLCKEKCNSKDAVKE